MITSPASPLSVIDSASPALSPRAVRLARQGSAASLALLTLLAMGCADVVTFSRESREQGMTAYKAGSYASAAGDFKNAIRQNPADYHSHYYLASCYAHDGSYHQAIEQYQTCLGVMENSLEGKSDKVFRMKVLDGLAQSIAKAEDHQTPTVASMHQGPRKAEDFMVTAKVNRYSGDADGAIEAYTQAALLDPSDFDIAKEYGLYAVNLKQNQLADPQLRRAYTLNDKDEQVNAALRSIGVVPGPGLKEEKDLAKPVIPEGPIPKVDLTTIHLQNPFTSTPAASSVSTDGSASSSDSSPRD